MKRDDDAMNDAYVLHRAAIVLRRRSKRPRNFLLRVLCEVLEGVARKIEAG